MEESFEVHSEDNRPPEKNKKRRLKTPSQVKALEQFYSEHRYPSEKKKSQLAESLGLTEKQVSGWFCHRRLKDKKSLYGEAFASGRHDHSSGIIQDHGSGHRQDSCGSTKQGDNRHCDPREVESRRFSGQDNSPTDLAYDHGHRQDGNFSDADGTSSERSLPLQHRPHHQNEAHLDMATSAYLKSNENIVPINLMGTRTRTGPSGYLKVKGQVEHPAIIAVKRQLGSHYLEDGPPLGVEFDPLPPDAFESSITDPDNEPYHLGDQDLQHSPDAPRTHIKPKSGVRCEGHNSKMISHDSDFHVTSFRVMPGSDYRENCFTHQSSPKPLLQNHSNYPPGWNLPIGIDEGFPRERSVYDGSRPGRMRAKHDVQGRTLDSVSSHHLRPYSQKVTGGQREPLWFKSEDASPGESKYPDITYKRSNSLKMEDGRLSKRMTKVAKREQDGFPKKQFAGKASMAETAPWTNHKKRSAAEMPSSFSEDETAETCSSDD
ncbi:homeobox-DDT domain protein RLT1 [Diospyros lotus]|uniref:homeobox-DDT domain protein RLT1 n=1 Tax=Diospyros lotus TaxID=55363 RepID=UPI002256254F|nr:homeobox-DDT domain protein RLT1 [Diospyros lotus]